MVRVRMQWCMCNAAVTVALQGCIRQAALERRDLSCTQLALHELESIFVIIAYENICIVVHHRSLLFYL